MKRDEIQAGRRGRRSSDAARRRSRPALEALEARRLLAITVDTLADTFDGSIADGTISLRDAIAASPAGGTIDFAVTGTINLALGEVVVQDRIIEGPGASLLTIDAHGTSRVFTTRGTTTLSGLTITGGHEVRGGGIRNDVTGVGENHLTVIDSVVTGNTALRGGGIHAGGSAGDYGHVTVRNSTISDNTASDRAGSDEPFGYGNGGGIDTGYSDVTVDKSTVSGNHADSRGGGIFGVPTITNSTISGNSAPLRANINDPYGGAGVYALGATTIANSTVSGNQGEGICGTAVVANSTITNNKAGIFSLGAGATLVNSIVAGNGDPTYRDVTGNVNVTASRNNLIGDPGNSAVNGTVVGPPTGGLSDGVNGNIVGVFDVGLGPLADNGGPTKTHALFHYSLAINRGDNSLVPTDPSTGLPYTTDQTGAARIFDGGTIDMGAVEFQGTPVPSTVVNTATDDLAANALTSLREAIGFASRLGGTVTFDPAVFATPQTLALVHGPITVDGTSVPVTIAGPGRDLATVDAGGAPSIFVTLGTTTISGLTLTGSRFILVEPTPDNVDGKQYVGAIFNALGTLTVQDSRIADNETRGILNTDTLTVENSIISRNQADSGGGIWSLGNFQSIVQLPRTANGPIATISNSIIDGNSAHRMARSDGGVGVAVDNGMGGGIICQGTTTIYNSTISNNESVDGGGICAFKDNTALVIDETTIVNTSILHNSAVRLGGGIDASDHPSHPHINLTVVNSTISGNSAGSGGGISAVHATVINSTISGNSAGGEGGGGRLGFESTVRNSTIANNTASGFGGGLYSFHVTSVNSIITGNLASGVPSDVDNGGGTVLNADSAYNLIGALGSGGHGDFGGLADGVNGNIIGVDPSLVLGPLADNGGPTRTHALLPNSPALNAGSNVFLQPLSSAPTGVTLTLLPLGRGSLPGQTTFTYRVSAIDGAGETLASTEVSVTTGSSDKYAVRITWDEVPGALGYKIYGRTQGAEQLLGFVGNVRTFDDNGTQTPYGALPSANTTGLENDQRGSGFARVRGGTVDIGAFEVQDDLPTIVSHRAAVTAGEGSLATNTGSFGDPEGLDTVTLTASSGDVVKFGNAWIWSDQPADGPAGPTTVTITATDAFGLKATTTFTLTVNNVAPTPSITGVPASGHSPAGTPIALGSSVTDPSTADAAAGFTYQWTVRKNGVPYASPGTASGFSFTPDDDGTYVVTLIATDKDGGASQPVSATIIVDESPLAVTAFDVAEGALQRSFIRKLAVTFDRASGIEALITEGRVRLTKFGLDGQGAGVTVPLDGVLTASGQTLRFDFGANGLGNDRNTAAADGYYQVGLDLDGDGVFETSRYFYRLLGDVNGDRAVNATDFALIQSAYGSSLLSERDVNGDGVINALDRLLAIRNNARSLAAWLRIDD